MNQSRYSVSPEANRRPDRTEAGYCLALLSTLLVAVGVFLIGGALSEIPGGQEAKLVASDASPNDYLGDAVAMDEGTAIVGSGEALYVFERQSGGWSEAAKIAPDASLDRISSFGETVDIDGGTIAVGAPYSWIEDTPGAGYVFIFEEGPDGWYRTDLLSAPDADRYDQFGSSVSIDGNRLLVGSPYQDLNGSAGNSERDAVGSVYVFVRTSDGWTLKEQFMADDPNSGETFGRDLSLDMGRVAIGTAREAAYVFDQTSDGWEQTVRLTEGPVTDGPNQDLYGDVVALDEDTLLVGASWDESKHGGTGAAYVYHHTIDGWEQAAKLIGHDSVAQDSFGFDVALDGDLALVTAPWDDFMTEIAGHDIHHTLLVGITGEPVPEDEELEEHPLGEAAGAGYVFERTTDGWVEKEKLTALDPGYDDRLGWAAAIDKGTAVLTALQDSHDDRPRDGKPDELPEGGQGSAYAFSADGDGDDLADRKETWLGTDPGDPDTDGDLIDDGTETTCPTKPTEAEVLGLPPGSPLPLADMLRGTCNMMGPLE